MAVGFVNFTVKQLVELDACTRCGECVKWCQAYREKGDELTAPSVKVRELKALLKGEHGIPLLSRLLGGRKMTLEQLADFAAGAYRCTLCARCVAVCPVGISLRDLWLSTREELVARGLHPAGLNLARDAVKQRHNVVNYPNEERATWVDYMLEAPEDAYQRRTAEVVYFVGCIASFSPAVQSIPEAFVRLLDKVGVDFTILGEREHCCGFPLLAAGMREEAGVAREHNIRMVRQVGAKTVVFTCPSCYNTWMNDYSSSLPDVELIHSTQLLARLIEEGRLRLKDTSLRITYHDPCDLGRNSGEFEAPRRVLRRVPGASFVEIGYNRDKGLCCGGGGDLEIADPELAGGEATRTLEAFEATGADVVVTACQQCKRMLQTAREKRGSVVGILDIAELILRASEG
ncbi:MAG: (Fe-S)-binding protein [Chloroflexi bacterium]|nr:(Fe-S)-binding protein [Chloroflexota bacterium]